MRRCVTLPILFVQLVLDGKKIIVLFSICFSNIYIYIIKFVSIYFCSWSLARIAMTRFVRSSDASSGVLDCGDVDIEADVEHNADVLLSSEGAWQQRVALRAVAALLEGDANDFDHERRIIIVRFKFC